MLPTSNIKMQIKFTLPVKMILCVNVRILLKSADYVLKHCHLFKQTAQMYKLYKLHGNAASLQ